MKRTRVRLLHVAFAMAWLAAPAAAQQQKLIYVLPDLFGPDGLRVDSEAVLPNGETHSAHFNSSFQQSFLPFTSALASQLASVPLPTPASGFTFTYDPALGVFKRTTNSYGPILTDRAETLGRNRASIGVSYQRFTFDKIEGLSLDSIPVVFTHDNPAPGGRDDLVTTQNSISLRLAQFTSVFSYGVTDRFDVSVALPVVSVELNAVSLATIQRIGTNANHAVHFFYVPTGDHYGNEKTFTNGGSASGIGDVAVRLKYHLLKRGGLGLALGVEGRLPTGDEKDLLGAGAPGVRPFLVLSGSRQTLSPHLKLAYQWSGKSLLAGNVLTGTKGDLPDQGLLEAGVDVSAGKKLTLAIDFLGRRVIDGSRLVEETFTALDGHSTFPNIRFYKGSYTTADGAVGLKINPAGNLLVDLNVLFKLNNDGLRDRVAPLFQVEYGF
jgi:Putative MetA-pathway of phenol degradation